MHHPTQTAPPIPLTAPPRLRRRPGSGQAARTAPALTPILVAVGAALAYLLLHPSSTDLAGAEYRAAVFGHTGFAVWDTSWYGGHYLPAYSVLVPAMSWLIGTRLLGALSVVAAAASFQWLVGWRSRRAQPAGILFALGATASLLSGRITFTTAIPFALLALRVSRRRGGTGSGTSTGTGAGAGAGERSLRVAAAALLSAVTALTSPVAALFLAVAWAALLLTDPRLRYLLLLAATFAPILVLNVAFPETGVEPLALSALLPTAIFTAVALPLLRRRRELVAGIVIYAVSCAATWLVHSPVGANVLRLGPLCGASLLVYELWPHRVRLLCLLAIPLVWWQWSDAIRDVRAARDAPSTGAAFYRPLLHELDDLSGPAGPAAAGGFRIEIPFTALHWEARWVAPWYPLARGWERQVDIADNPLFYGGRLTAARYHAWLQQNAVRYVALPNTTLDVSARQERAVITATPGYLQLVWENRDWRLYEVDGAAPIVPRPLELRQLGSDTVTLTSRGPATTVLRVRWNPYWAITQGSGCVARAGAWTRLTVRRGGTVELGIRFSLARVRATTPRCT